MNAENKKLENALVEKGWRDTSAKQDETRDRWAAEDKSRIEVTKQAREQSNEYSERNKPNAREEDKDQKIKGKDGQTIQRRNQRLENDWSL